MSSEPTREAIVLEDEALDWAPVRVIAGHVFSADASPLR